MLVVVVEACTSDKESEWRQGGSVSGGQPRLNAKPSALQLSTFPALLPCPSFAAAAVAAVPDGTAPVAADAVTPVCDSDIHDGTRAAPCCDAADRLRLDCGLVGAGAGCRVSETNIEAKMFAVENGGRLRSVNDGSCSCCCCSCR